MTTTPDPFRVLTLTPTLDRTRIKRAYFDAIAHTPPHRDPEAFGRIRCAYEALMRPGGPEAAFLLVPPDPDADAAPYRERYGAEIERARERCHARRAGDACVARFVEHMRSSTLAALLDEFGAARAE
jgi:hypothetical protein